VRGLRGGMSCDGVMVGVMEGKSLCVCKRFRFIGIVVINSQVTSLVFMTRLAVDENSLFKNEITESHRLIRTTSPLQSIHNHNFKDSTLYSYLQPTNLQKPSIKSKTIS